MWVVLHVVYVYIKYNFPFLRWEEAAHKAVQYRNKYKEAKRRYKQAEQRLADTQTQQQGQQKQWETAGGAGGEGGRGGDYHSPGDRSLSNATSGGSGRGGGDDRRRLSFTPLTSFLQKVQPSLFVLIAVAVAVAQACLY